LKKDWRYSSYPFMREKSCLVDYEIRTDSLTTRIGAVFPLLTEKEQAVIDDLRIIQPLCYHVNGSVRGKMAITEADLQWLSDRYDFYVEKTGEKVKQFVLPQGSNAACALHVVRSEAKKSYRALHKVSEERKVPDILFDFLGLLANVCFVMAVYVNQVNGIQEIPFESKSYGVKKK
jgi:cob(I)alamin adenosyltransferase